METCFILGPLLVSLTMLAGSPAFAVAASAVMTAVGTWHFAFGRDRALGRG